MLPFQAPLYSAYDALSSNDLKLAEAEIQRYFVALENDPMALQYRRQLSDRQVFEADFVSIFTREKIDAWSVLSTVKMQRRDWHGARDDCYKQIELIDQHYGFAIPSWARPESRIPRDQELADRYLRLASQLANIFSELDDDDMSSRWSKISSAAVVEPVDPDEIWGQWIAEDGDEPEPIGLNIYDFSNWSIKKIEIDGEEWLVSLLSDLPGRASPFKFSTLVTVHVPTDPTSDVLAKSVRWRIWSLREAISSRLKRHDYGVFFGELQRRGERVLLYYATNESEVHLVADVVLNAAAELSPRIETQPDENWKEYSKWGGQSITITKPAAPAEQASDAGILEDENDEFLRQSGKLSESLTSVGTKIYVLLWVVNLVPPHSATIHKYIVDYLFELLNFLTDQETATALWHMVWKLPSFDPAAAVRALDMIELSTIQPDHHGIASFAAEALSDYDPERALEITEELKRQGYTLIHKPAGKIAVSFARRDIERGRALVAATRDYIIGLNEQPFSETKNFTELADVVAAAYPEESRKLLIEANNNFPRIDSRSTSAHVYIEALAVTKKVAPELLPTMCQGALKAAYALMAPSTDWMDFSGPRSGIYHICWIVPYVVLYNKRMALEVLTQAADMADEQDDETILDLLPSLAQAAGCLDIETSRDLANRLWTVFELRSQRNKSPGRTFINNRRIAEQPSPVEAFVKMNPRLAAERIATIIEICDLTVLPERQVELLSCFAVALDGEMQCAKKLILKAVERCRDCSSAFLRASALAQVAAAMHSLGLDASEACDQTINTIDTIGSSRSRLAASLDASKQCTENYPEFADKLLEKSATLLQEPNDFDPASIEQLYGLPRRHSSKLFFELIKLRRDDRQLTEWLSRIAESFAADKARAT